MLFRSVPPQDESSEPSKAIINSDNYQLINAFSWSVPEATIQLGMLTNNIFNTLIENNELFIERNCMNGGSTSISVVDNDSSNSISVGDEINVFYANCKSEALNDIIHGQQHLTINAISSDSFEVISDFNLYVPGADNGTEVSGLFKVLKRNSIFQDYLSVENVSDITISYLNLNDIWSNVFVEKSIDHIDKNYQITFGFEIFSDGIDSIVTCETKDAVSGLIYGEPNLFSVYCYGDENSLFHVDNSLDSEEDGHGSVSNSQETFTFSYQFEDVTEGMLFQPITPVAMDFMFTLATISTQDMRLDSVIVDDYQHIAYIIGADYADSSKGNIHKVDLVGMESKELVATEGTIELAKISMTGKFIYLLEKFETSEGNDFSKVNIYASESMTKLSSINFNEIVSRSCNACEFSHVSVADIFASPNEEGVWFSVVHYLQGAYGQHILFKLDNNEVTASSLILDSSFGGGERISIAVNEDHQLYTPHQETNNSYRWLSQFELNDNLLELVKKVKADDGESVYGIILKGSANGLVFTEKGKFFNGETLNLEWSAPFEPWMVAGTYPIIVSSELNKVYQLHGSNWEPSFKTFSLDKGVFIGQEKSNFIEGTYRGLIIGNGGPGYIVAVAPNRLVIIGKSYLP